MFDAGGTRPLYRTCPGAARSTCGESACPWGTGEALTIGPKASRNRSGR